MFFIDWCNNNEGFATILLAILTLIVSIIAIIVSIKTAKLPFRKKIDIQVFFEELNENKYLCNISVINTGNRMIGILDIYLKCKNLNLNEIYEKNVLRYIQPSTITNYKLKFEVFDDDIEREDIIEIVITDTEKDEHIFKQVFAMM